MNYTAILANWVVIFAFVFQDFMTCIGYQCFLAVDFWCRWNCSFGSCLAGIDQISCLKNECFAWPWLVWQVPISACCLSGHPRKCFCPNCHTEFSFYLESYLSNEHLQRRVYRWSFSSCCCHISRCHIAPFSIVFRKWKSYSLEHHYFLGYSPPLPGLTYLYSPAPH